MFGDPSEIRTPDTLIKSYPVRGSRSVKYKPLGIGNPPKRRALCLMAFSFCMALRSVRCWEFPALCVADWLAKDWQAARNLVSVLHPAEACPQCSFFLSALFQPYWQNLKPLHLIGGFIMQFCSILPICATLAQERRTVRSIPHYAPTQRR